MNHTVEPRKRKLLAGLYAASFLACFVFLLWKCRFGYANIDEAFYLTIPYRMCRGDSLLTHEWHLSQLSGFLLYPAMTLYLRLFDGTEGIFLHFRYLFTVVWALSALFIFLRLRSISLWGAMISSIAYMIFTPYGIMALSYNSMGIMLLLSACVILATAKKHSGLQWFAAGILFAGAVLCCPYLVVLYAAFTLAAILLRRKYKRLPQIWLMVTAGCGILLLVFCWVLFSRTSLRDVIRVFPELFNDPDHPHISLWKKTLDYFSSILFSSKAFLPCFLTAVIVTVYSKLRKKPELGLVIMCALIAVMMLSSLLETHYLNHVMFPINLIAPYCALHSRKREIRLPFWSIWIPGAIYSYCICLSSNQAFYAISSAGTVMTVASIVMLAGFLPTLDPARSKTLLRRTVCAAAALLLGLQILSELALRYYSVYWERMGLQYETVLAESGPDKGILMTPERFADYTAWESDMARIRDDDEIRQLLVISDNTHLYLSAQKDMSTYSAWLSSMSDASLSRLDAYFSLFPEKAPDAIYIEAPFVRYAEHYTSQGYRCEQLDSGGCLLKK